MRIETTYLLLIGTYTRTKNDGIYVYSFNSKNGETSFVSKTDNVKNPSYLILSPDKNFVFAVNESGEKTSDYVSSFKFDGHNGHLHFINKVACGGTDPCYLSTDASAKRIFVANYTSGSLSEISVNEFGALDPSIWTIRYKGQSADPERQAGPHVHAAVFSPDYTYLLVTDLGTDKIETYHIEKNNLKWHAELRLEAGSGPRHLVFNKNGTFVYAILELSAAISVLKHNDGRLECIQTLKLSAEGFSGISSAADIHLSQDGLFLYASNRGTANEIIIFSVDQHLGTLTYVDRHSSLGVTPRNFIIDPSGNFLLVANQESNDIVIFKRDFKTGKLTPTGKKIEVEAPVCLQLAEVE